MFVLESSDNDTQRWHDKLALVEDVVERLDVASHSLNVGLVQYAPFAQNKLYLYQYVFREEIMQVSEWAYGRGQAVP